jgi:hypothetical protein
VLSVQKSRNLTHRPTGTLNWPLFQTHVFCYLYTVDLRYCSWNIVLQVSGAKLSSDNSISLPETIPLEIARAGTGDVLLEWITITASCNCNMCRTRTRRHCTLSTAYSHSGITRSIKLFYGSWMNWMRCFYIKLKASLLIGINSSVCVLY